MIRGLKLYTPQSDYTKLWELVKTNAISHLFISIELAQDSNFIQQLPKGVKTALIFPVLYDSDDILSQQPEAYAITETGTEAKEEWVRFICPSQDTIIHQKITRYIEAASNAQPDIISIDFIRYFAFWEKTTPENADQLQQSCFCPLCVEDFSKQRGVSIPKGSTKEQAAFILKNHKESFIEYKCATIENLLRRIISKAKERIPSIQTSLHLVPWLPGEYDNAIDGITGQDVTRLGTLVDIVTPMCYAHMLYKDASWIRTYLETLSGNTEAAILPSIQVAQCYREEHISSSLFTAYIEACQVPASSGVLYWSGEELLKDKEKQNCLP